MADKLNTHYYDGSLKEQYKNLVNIQNTKTDFLQQKWDINVVMKEIYEGLTRQNRNPLETQQINQMLRLFYTDPQSNYDSLNEIDVLDLLCRTWYFVKKEKPEDQSIFYDQLLEIKNGTCSQGRSTRLYQVYYTYF